MRSAHDPGLLEFPSGRHGRAQLSGGVWMHENSSEEASGRGVSSVVMRTSLHGFVPARSGEQLWLIHMTDPSCLTEPEELTRAGLTSSFCSACDGATEFDWG